jgi:hypothetical protein
MREGEEEEDDPRVGGQWRIATLSRRGKRSPAAGEGENGERKWRRENGRSLEGLEGLDQSIYVRVECL